METYSEELLNSSLAIREYFANHSEEENYHLAREKALRNWRNNTRFCPRCGEALRDSQTEVARECPGCGNLVFPRIEPCIIVAIHKDGKILLARHVQRNQEIYACIAGFIEAGESAEHALRREIREEVGLEVTNIQYRGSQSWPFPDQLMLGYTADWLSGEIHVQQEELMDAQWFDPEALPKHPRPGSISYELIHNYNK